jgi:hypothetical protein
MKRVDPASWFNLRAQESAFFTGEKPARSKTVSPARSSWMPMNDAMAIEGSGGFRQTAERAMLRTNKQADELFTRQISGGTPRPLRSDAAPVALRPTMSAC